MTCRPTGVYGPANSQLAQQFAIAPFRPTNIPLYGVNRTAGELFPSLEGSYLYVEQCDAPVIASFVDRTNGKLLSFLLRTGLEIHGDFKGVTLTHPLYIANADPLTLRVTLGQGATSESNQYAHPIHNGLASWRTITNTAIDQTIGIYVPPNSRLMEKVIVQLLTTTVTGARARQAFTIGGTFAVQANPPQFTLPDGRAYTNTYNEGEPLSVVAGTIAGTSVARGDNMILPSYADEVTVQISGTGLALPTYVGAIFS